MAFNQQDFLFEIGAPSALVGEPGSEVGVSWTDNALFDEIEHVLDRPFDARALGAQGLQMRLAFTHGRRAIVQQIGEKRLQAFGAEQALGHGVDHHCLERLIAHADPGAYRFAAAQAT
ncbi:MAG: hypothetical protein V4459_00945 [Pseudomonadota bacterium]